MSRLGPSIVFGSISLMFFLSGAAALVYQVVWVRSLTLIFGGSHLAVTAVLSIFMGGLALGGYGLGRYVDRVEKPLRLYAYLEFGIAAGALVFAGLVEIYPTLYVVLARGHDEATTYLTALRLLFAIVALIVPTTLMGGTLPVLSRFVSRQPDHLRGHLGLLYGVNTLGAVCGALLAGFVFLRLFGVSTTLSLAVATNVAIGVVSLILQGKAATSSVEADIAPPAATRDPRPRAATQADGRRVGLPAVVLWGIGLSGFCALGYEVLWTRVLTIAIGASVYGFTIILVAFLTGIALGSAAYGGLVRALRIETPTARTLVAWFGLTQLVIGIAALLVTVYLRDIPANAVGLQRDVLEAGFGAFGTRTWASFVLAFAYMVVPALFMGAAFPLAGEALARHRGAVGRAVGEVLAWNTVGAIGGAAASGLVLVRVFGIERALQMLVLVNIGFGAFVLTSLRPARWLRAGVVATCVGAAAWLAFDDQVARVWDRKYFAIFRSNQPEAFRTAELVREAVENTDVLYYAEGLESIVSVIQVKGGEKAFLTNGRVEASTHLQAQQNQFALGHLPMLLAREPKEVLVVGLGSGMTAGATAVHPHVERVTIVEIEPQVVGVARAFEAFNHAVLDHPRVRVVLNDGRNFLLTTERSFDVITADPVHPWFRGAGYLYSSEYFRLAARRLRPGGVIAQWLPLYELTPQDLESIVRTFREHFRHTAMWLTHYDAQILGSQQPFAIDEAELDRRIAVSDVAGDLQRVMMGSATDLLSYFVMGTNGMERFGWHGVLNTDDRPYLEFSAPFSIATPDVMAANIEAIASQRESILPYLRPGGDDAAVAAQLERSTRQLAAGRLADPALALFLAGRRDDPRYVGLLERLDRDHPSYAPGRFLRQEDRMARAHEPRLLQQATFAFLGDDGVPTDVEMSVVLVPVSRTRASVMFVDNRARVVHGQVYLDDPDRDDAAGRFASDVMGAMHVAYQKDAIAAAEQGRRLPSTQTLRRITAVIAAKMRGVSHAP